MTRRNPSEFKFDCTMCGRCCHDLRLPVSVDEAAEWIDRGGKVEILTDAAPDSESADYGPSLAAYQKSRAFPARSGDVGILVTLTLVAAFKGPCPFLKSDMSCGNYEMRPDVCRVYPAEANPFRAIDPRSKACPDEAWLDTQPLLLREGRIVPEDVRRAVEGMRAAGPRDVGAKARLAELLGIDVAAFANEGLAVHRPPQAILRSTLEHARTAVEPPVAVQPWRVATNRGSTLAMLEQAGSEGIMAGDDYIGFFPSDWPVDGAQTESGEE